MIDPRNKITIFHDDNSVFTEYTQEAADYSRDDFSITLSSTEDYIYAGFYKPFGDLYVELTTANTNANTLSAEIYDGTSWVSVTLTDDSKGYTRDGFQHWDKSDMKEVEINSVTLYYIRFRPSSDHTATDVRGLNLVFSDDNQLEQEFEEITDAGFLPSGRTSHIMSHVSARNHIIQKLRNIGYLKYDANSRKENLTYWDLHDVFEIRQASAFLTLSKIFFNLSDSVDDNWFQKYMEYQKKFDQMFALARLSIDTDDDGVVDGGEDGRNAQTLRWTR